jgi:hypothetical protein
MDKIHNVDCMKFRKATHIAGVDVEAIIAEKGKCIVTIKDAYYSKEVDVSGNKIDGYFLEFTKYIKPMVVNSGNRKVIASLCKQVKQLTPIESRNISNWVGMQIELTFDASVKMMGQVVGGIKVKPQAVVIEKKTISEERFSKALQSIADGNYTRKELEENFVLTDEQIKRL